MRLFRIRELGASGNILTRTVRLKTFEDITIGVRCISVHELDPLTHAEIRQLWPATQNTEVRP